MKLPSTLPLSLANFSRLAQSTWGACKTPYGIAVLASVGVHGILFAFGPSTGTSLASLNGTDAAAAERVVPMVELSATEQARLPNFSTPSLPFSIEGLDSFNSNNGNPRSSPPALPSLSGSTNRRRSLSPSFPRITGQPLPLDRSGGYRTPFFASPNLPIFNIPTPSSVRPAIVLPPRSSQPIAPAASTPQTNPQEALAAARALEAADAARNPQATAPSATASTPGNTETPANSGNPSNATSTPDNAVPEEVAIAPAPEAAAAVAEILASLVYKVDGTTPGEAEVARTNWLNQSQTAIGEVALQTADRSISMDSNIRICVANPPVDGQVGVVVDAQGAVVGDPTLLKSTGYATLNSAALNVIPSLGFNQGTAPTAYIVTVDVGYDAENCVDANRLVETAGE